MFEKGFFPDTFKLAHITSIWKQKGLKSSKLVYRPISLLATPSKIIESIMHNQLLFHFMENGIISDRQAAYLNGDSTIHQLIYLVHKIRLSWKSGNVAQGVFCDIEGAFEKVWHLEL